MEILDHKDDFILDSRTVEDIRKQFATLAASYTPEWNMDVSDPDVGSVLAMIFANHLEGSVWRYNQMLHKCKTEFMNMLGISLRSAFPSSGIVTGEIMPQTVAGIPFPCGSRLLGSDNETDPLVIFETTSDVYLTASRIRHILSISGEFGKIIPILGGPHKFSLSPTKNRAQDVKPLDEQGFSGVSLFDYQEEGVEQSMILLYHKTIFDIPEGARIRVQLPTEGVSSNDYADPTRFQWSFFQGEDFVPFQVESDGDCGVYLMQSQESDLMLLEKEAYHVICLKALGQIKESMEVSRVGISSHCDWVLPTFISHNDQDIPFEHCLPFGDSASLFDECYIGQDQIFRQAGSLITLNFQLSYTEKLVSFTPQQEAANLKIIKRKTKATQIITSHTRPDEIAIEYYNGIGWRRLLCQGDYSQIFQNNTQGEVSISFYCPEDWSSLRVSGYESRSLRLRITRADNCYMQPCLHIMPVLKKLNFSYSYEKKWSMPQHLQQVTGTKHKDLTEDMYKESALTIFEPLPYGGNGLYLGFDAPMEVGPVSILFHIEENTHVVNTPIEYAYSSLSGGFKPLPVVDNTHNMERTGTLVFMPPSDMAPISLEGISAYWIRLVDEKNTFQNSDQYHSYIRNILMNAVEIKNIEKPAEETFYVRSPVAHMSFPLTCENILTTEVFVSEKVSLTQPQMQQMLAKNPEDIRVEYDFLGGIRSFYVRWQEVDNFDHSKSSDRHYAIDRMNNRILFGDGIHVMLPPAQSGVAFTVEASCCQGVLGNLPTGTVNVLFDQVLYLNNISNPIPTYGGSNIENIALAHKRGANMISSRNRLVSELDYVREVNAFSDSISKIKVVAGLNLEGETMPHKIVVIVMMNDYSAGSHSFHSMRARLASHLLERSEGTLEEQDLLLSEPLYLKISLDIWVVSDNTKRSFEIQNAILQSVEDFLSPVGTKVKTGWAIGEIPSEAQIQMMLQSVHGEIQLKRFIATARYVDRYGVHESSLDRLPDNPFLLGVSGQHRIYIELPKN